MTLLFNLQYAWVIIVYTSNIEQYYSPLTACFFLNIFYFVLQYAYKDWVRLKVRHCHLEELLPIQSTVMFHWTTRGHILVCTIFFFFFTVIFVSDPGGPALINTLSYSIMVSEVLITSDGENLSADCTRGYSDEADLKTSEMMTEISKILSTSGCSDTITIGTYSYGFIAFQDQVRSYEPDVIAN